jgi:hypothetical protein
VADAGLAGVDRQRSHRNMKPIEIIMTCAAGRIWPNSKWSS